MNKRLDAQKARAGGLPRRQVIVGDAIERMRELPTASVDCVVTSPPYFRLRDYGVEGQVGQEPDIEAWAEKLTEVMGEVARVLKSRGGVWLNLGDAFSRRSAYGSPFKGLLLGPERLLLRLAKEGWIVRSKVIWAKPNPLPNPALDRLTMSYEVVYFLTRRSHYYFDLDSIRVPFKTDPDRRRRRSIGGGVPAAALGSLAAPREGLKKGGPPRTARKRFGKNPGDVWTIPKPNFRGPHYATFPEALVRRPILASCPEAVCTECDEPWRRTIAIRREGDADEQTLKRRKPDSPRTAYSLGPLEPCGCGAPTRPGVVLDPFIGSGTTGLVAELYDRDWVGIELNRMYAQMAQRRIEASRARREARATAKERRP